MVPSAQWKDVCPIETVHTAKQLIAIDGKQLETVLRTTSSLDLKPKEWLNESAAKPLSESHKAESYQTHESKSKGSWSIALHLPIKQILIVSATKCIPRYRLYRIAFGINAFK